MTVPDASSSHTTWILPGVIAISTFDKLPVWIVSYATGKPLRMDPVNLKQTLALPCAFSFQTNAASLPAFAILGKILTVRTVKLGGNLYRGAIWRFSIEVLLRNIRGPPASAVIKTV